MDKFIQQNIPISLPFFIHTHSKLSICQVHQGFIPINSIFQALQDAYSISSLGYDSSPSAGLSQLEINVYTSLIIDACALQLSGPGKFVMPKEIVANDEEFLRNLLAILQIKTKDQSSSTMEELKIEIGNYLQLQLPSPQSSYKVFERSSLHKSNGEFFCDSAIKTPITLSDQQRSNIFNSSSHGLPNSSIFLPSSNQPPIIRGNSNSYNSSFQQAGKELSGYPSQSFSSSRNHMHSSDPTLGSTFKFSLNNSIPPIVFDKQLSRHVSHTNSINNMSNVQSNYLSDDTSYRNNNYPRNSNSYQPKPYQTMGLNRGPQPNQFLALNTSNNNQNNRNSLNNLNNQRQGITNDDFESKDPMIRFLAALRKVGLDIIFPQGLQDKILAVVYSSILEKPISCLRDLIDLTMVIKDSNVLSQIDQVSKTKIRGVLALLKQSNILVTEILDEGRSVRLVWTKEVQSFGDFREVHDKYVVQFLSDNKITMPLSMKAEIIWMFEEQAKKERLLIIDTFIAKTAEFLSTYEYKQTKNIGPKTLLPMKSDNSDLVVDGESDFRGPLTLFSDNHKSPQNSNSESKFQEFDPLMNSDDCQIPMTFMSSNIPNSTRSSSLLDENISNMIVNNDKKDHVNQKNTNHESEQIFSSVASSSFFTFVQQDYQSLEPN